MHRANLQRAEADGNTNHTLSQSPFVTTNLCCIKHMLLTVKHYKLQ